VKVGYDGPPGLPLVLRDASLGFRDLSLEVGDGFSHLADHLRIGDFAHRKPSGFQGLQGVAIPLELNPVPSDFAIAVTTQNGTS
jgi:hypothetical protein